MSEIERSEKRAEYLTWEEYFMGIAAFSSKRSKDPSTQVGSCIVKDNRILSIGYNGLTKGMNDDTFHWASIGEKTGEIDKIKDPWILHAERNAVYNYRGSLQDFEGSTLYVVYFPCHECAKTIVQVGIKKVVWLRMYSNQRDVDITRTMFRAKGIIDVPYNEGVDFTKEEIQETTDEIQKMVKRFSPKPDSPNIFIGT